MSIKDLQVTNKDNDKLIEEYKATRQIPPTKKNSLQEKVPGYVKMFIDVDLESEEFKSNGMVRIYPERIAEKIFPDKWYDLESNDKNQVKTAIRKVADQYIKSKGYFIRNNTTKANYIDVSKNQLTVSTQGDKGDPDPVKPAKGSKGKSWAVHQRSVGNKSTLLFLVLIILILIH